ncbi:MAG: YigZ family protein [Wolinella sp.]
MEDKLSVILEESQGFFEERGSRFLSFLFCAKVFKKRLSELQDSHPKAVHFVNASRVFNEFGHIEESFSDDGEPRGTSGMPTLKVLRGYGLVESALITVRYFGGTLLGSGGLVRAYTQSAKNAILNAHLLAYKPTKTHELMVEYPKLARIEYLAKTLGIALEKREFLPLCVRCFATGEVRNLERFLELAGRF